MAQNITVDVHVHAADKTARDAAAVRLVQAEGRCINVSSLTLSSVTAFALSPVTFLLLYPVNRCCRIYNNERVNLNDSSEDQGYLCRMHACDYCH